MNNKVKFIKILSLACFLGLTSISIQSCKEDDKPPTGTTTTDDDNTDPIAGKDYLLFEGVKVEFRNPEMGKMSYMGGDTSLEWYGNKPVGVQGDTVMFIRHPSISQGEPLHRVAGSYEVDESPFFKAGKVGIYVRWGTLDGYPYVILTEGDYELKRVDGKWVSILKNGKGTWTKSNGDKVNYTGIEFKATWPN